MDIRSWYIPIWKGLNRFSSMLLGDWLCSGVNVCHILWARISRCRLAKCCELLLPSFARWYLCLHDYMLIVSTKALLIGMITQKQQFPYHETLIFRRDVSARKLRFRLRCLRVSIDEVTIHLPKFHQSRSESREVVWKGALKCAANNSHVGLALAATKPSINHYDKCQTRKCR